MVLFKRPEARLFRLCIVGLVRASVAALRSESLNNKGGKLTAIAFIGLGNMGAPLARLIARTGMTQAVYDPYPPALAAFDGVARRATSPADAAADAEFVCICVRDDDQVKDVLFGDNGVASTLQPGAIVLIHSTIAVESVLEIAERLGRLGIMAIDAPVSRTREAEDGPFVISLVGGDDSEVERCRPIVNSFSTRVEHMGSLGAGMATKIANNLVAWVQIVVGVQSANLARNWGVDVPKFVSVMESNGNLTSTMRGMISTKFGDPPAKHVIDLMVSQSGIGEKDLNLALHSAQAVGLDIRMIDGAQSVVAQTMSEPPVPVS